MTHNISSTTETRCCMCGAIKDSSVPGLYAAGWWQTDKGHWCPACWNLMCEKDKKPSSPQLEVELDAIRRIVEVVEKLDETTRIRALSWVIFRYGNPASDS